jgi:hypothetical protein
MPANLINRKHYYRSHGVTPDRVSRTSWQKSASSNLNGACVEIGQVAPDRIGVRDTKDNGNGPILFFTRIEWEVFISAVKSGEFDDIN